MASVVDRLNAIGIPAIVSKTRGRTFQLTRTRDHKLRIREGKNVDITVRTDKRKRQALITVTEKPRTINETVRFGSYEDFTSNGRGADKALRSRVRNLLSFVPNSRFKVIECRLSSPNTDYDANRWNVYSAKVKRTTNTTKTSFLVGFDEGATIPFVCVLRKPVDSLKDAYTELLPKDVDLKKGYERQGEWFFNPVGAKLSKTLNGLVHKLKIQRLGTPRRSRYWREPRPSHEACVLKHDGQVYAIGIVKDVRKGHHEPLVLNGWYEVHRNNESKINPTVRSYD